MPFRHLLRRAGTIELKNLNVSYNPIMSGMAFADDECAVVGGGIDDSYDNPDTFQEAWNHPDAEDKEH